MVEKEILPLTMSKAAFQRVQGFSVPVPTDNDRPPLNGFDCAGALLNQNFIEPVNPVRISRFFNFSQAGGFLPASSQLQVSLATQGERVPQDVASANTEDKAIIDLKYDVVPQQQMISEERILRTNRKILNSMSSMPLDVEMSSKQTVKIEKNDVRATNSNVFDLVSRTDEVNKLETGNWKTEDDKEISAYLSLDVTKMQDSACSAVRQESPDLFESVPTEIGTEEINDVLQELGADKILNLKWDESPSFAMKDIADVKPNEKAEIQQKNDVELNGLPPLGMKLGSSFSEMVKADNSILDNEESLSDDNFDFQCSQLPKKKRRGRKTPLVAEKCQRSTKKMKMPPSFNEVENHNTCKSQVEKQALSIVTSGSTIESETAKSLKNSEQKAAAELLSRKSVRIQQKKSFSSRTQMSKAVAMKGADFLDELVLASYNTL